jgi:hypothetical protein
LLTPESRTNAKDVTLQSTPESSAECRSKLAFIAHDAGRVRYGQGVACARVCRRDSGPIGVDLVSRAGALSPGAQGFEDAHVERGISADI